MGICILHINCITCVISNPFFPSFSPILHILHNVQTKGKESFFQQPSHPQASPPKNLAVQEEFPQSLLPISASIIFFTFTTKITINGFLYIIPNWQFIFCLKPFAMAVTLIFFLLTRLFVNSESISRVDFPDGFVFGTASSAYQVVFSFCLQR